MKNYSFEYKTLEIYDSCPLVEANDIFVLHTKSVYYHLQQVLFMYLFI